ncbi:Auxin-responsive protein saur32 [Asimina triloba]
MSNVPKSLCDSSLTLFKLVISGPDPWPFSLSSFGHHHHFHLHLPHLHHSTSSKKDIPKGCLAIIVGQGEEQQRFVVPIIYFNHPLFVQLLKEAEEEYGFEQQGPITIPCHVAQFRYVQGIIDKEKSLQPHQPHQHHHIRCFGA